MIIGKNMGKEQQIDSEVQSKLGINKCSLFVSFIRRHLAAAAADCQCPCRVRPPTRRPFACAAALAVGAAVACALKKERGVINQMSYANFAFSSPRP